MQLFVQIHPQSGARIPQSFEGLVEAMQGLAGMYFEMDGSFVWVDHSCSPPKQMDAMVYDCDGRLAYVEVKGHCSERQWQLLCRAMCELPLELDQGTPLSAKIDNLLRVHEVGLGNWITASQVAAQLACSDVRS